MALRHPLARMVAAAPLVAVPLVSVAGSLSALQYPMLYASIWMILWSPRRWPPRVAAFTIVLLTGLSTVLSLVLVPLLALRLALRRDQMGVLLEIALAPGVAAQLVPRLFGTVARDPGAPQRFDLWWACREYVTWGMPRAIFGDRWLASPHPDPAGHQVLVLAAWAVLAAAVGLGLARYTRPSRMVAGLMLLTGFVLFIASAMAHGGTDQRSLVVPVLTTLAAIAALLRPGDTRAKTPEAGIEVALLPLIIFSTVLGVVMAANLRPLDGRALAPGWDRCLIADRTACTAPDWP
jgi:hypothetical protein